MRAYLFRRLYKDKKLAFHYACEDTHADPHKLEGIFDAQNVVLISGLRLGLGSGIHF